MYFDTVIILLSKGSEGLLTVVNNLKQEAEASTLTCLIKVCINNQEKNIKDMYIPGVMTFSFEDKSDEFMINKMLPYINGDKYLIIMSDEVLGVNRELLENIHSLLCWENKKLIGINVESFCSSTHKDNKVLNCIHNQSQDMFASKYFMATTKRDMPHDVLIDYGLFLNFYFKERGGIFKVIERIRIPSKTMVSECKQIKEKAKSFKYVMGLFNEPEHFKKSVLNKSDFILSILSCSIRTWIRIMRLD